MFMFYGAGLFLLFMVSLVNRVVLVWLGVSRVTDVVW